jgi:hypothetical protein
MPSSGHAHPLDAVTPRDWPESPQLRRSRRPSQVDPFRSLGSGRCMTGIDPERKRVVFPAACCLRQGRRAPRRVVFGRRSPGSLLLVSLPNLECGPSR